MNSLDLSQVERAVQAMARVSLENERYFCDLDGEMGDADFGKSIADGFRAILADFDQIDRSSVGAFLVKLGMIFSSRVGGTSGPIWGTAFLRAGTTVKGKQSVTLADLAAMGRNAVEGMKARGNAAAGDKTILDAVIPAVDQLAAFAQDRPDDLPGALRAASAAATAAIEGTRSWVAKRGRASYAAERTAGTLDPGIVAAARMLAAVVDELEKPSA